MSKNILLVLKTSLKMIYVDQLFPSVYIGNEKFTNILESDFIGFYDWLRIRPDQICGVRLTPFDFAEATIRQIPNCSYLKLLSDCALEIYFADTVDYLEEISCDQDFGSVKVYISNNSKYAIGFNIENLTLVEQENLIRYP